MKGSPTNSDSAGSFSHGGALNSPSLEDLNRIIFSFVDSFSSVETERDSEGLGDKVGADLCSLSVGGFVVASAGDVSSWRVFAGGSKQKDYNENCQHMTYQLRLVSLQVSRCFENGQLVLSSLLSSLPLNPTTPRTLPPTGAVEACLSTLTLWP